MHFLGKLCKISSPDHICTAMSKSTFQQEHYCKQNLPKVSECGKCSVLSRKVYPGSHSFVIPLGKWTRNLYQHLTSSKPTIQKRWSRPSLNHLLPASQHGVDQFPSGNTSPFTIHSCLDNPSDWWPPRTGLMGLGISKFPKEFSLVYQWSIVVPLGNPQNSPMDCVETKSSSCQPPFFVKLQMFMLKLEKCWIN